MDRRQPGEVYNICAGNEMSNIQVAKSILEILGKPNDLVRFVEDRPSHDIRYSIGLTSSRRSLRNSYISPTVFQQER